MREILELVVARRSLSQEQARQAMQTIMDGQATPAQVAGFLVALRMKGETAEEVAGMAQAMRAKALRVEVPFPLLDTCGTGGDRAGTFNFSTAAAIVCAAAGAKVAKHGNRAVSSASGSADLLEACGVRIALGPEGVAQCIREVGIGFCFAPVFHPAMKHAAPVRRELGIRTVFNILGPLTNPAGAQFQVLGVADPGMGEMLAQVLRLLGVRRAWVVHGEDGLDELTLCAPTRVWDVQTDGLRFFTLTPEGVGLPRARPEDLKGGTPQENAQRLWALLKGERGPLRDGVVLNAGAGLVVYGLAGTLAEGIRLAQEAVDSGRAGALLERWVAVSQRVGGG
ncbi:MAG: anthranilate phosphoribosyltransferase [Dehalococcoidia bacterium]|nr:anthranilate phosphoribosyltransferase [Dehalococcoidia bacterium]MDW8120658.1 anthranilate phosphoribosyltransferase [Chloroflexota bacterium]